MEDTTMESASTASYGAQLSGKNLIGWAVAIFKQPKDFFSGMAKSGGLMTPILYALFWIAVSNIVELIVSKARPGGVSFGAAVEIGWLFLGPLVLLGIGFVSAAIFFVIWHLMGSKNSYETAFRCWAYLTPVSVLGALLGIVPFLNILALGYGTFLLVTASTTTHGISVKKSWAVWGSLLALLLALVGISAVAQRSLQDQTGGFTQIGANELIPNPPADLTALDQAADEAIAAQQAADDQTNPQ